MNFLRSWDAYGVPISFSFHGQDSCKTLVGSFFTIVTRAIIAALLLAQFLQVYNRQYELNRTFTVEDVINNPTTYKMDTSNFNVALRVKTSDKALQADLRRYFRVVLLFEKNMYVDQSLKTYYTDSMEAPRCGDDGFLLTETDKKTYDFSEFYCIPPGYYNATISGQWTSFKNENIAMVVRSC